MIFKHNKGYFTLGTITKVDSETKTVYLINGSVVLDESDFERLESHLDVGVGIPETKETETNETRTGKK